VGVGVGVCLQAGLVEICRFEGAGMGILSSAAFVSIVSISAKRAPGAMCRAHGPLFEVLNVCRL
jgi:hypothetical protein